MSESSSPTTRWRFLGGVLVLVVLLAAGYVWFKDEQPIPAPPSFPAPFHSASPYKNTSADARYVGSDACTACHKTRTASFRNTGMGRSTALVDPAVEPPDAVFDHPKSKRRFHIAHKDGKLWHRELLLTHAADEVVLAEFPVKYAVGSGRHGRTYLAEADGFLVESPVTWYTSRKAWDMSPGYDHANHQGFERSIGEGCLICHTGHAEALEQSVNRIHIKEAPIGCERCHGPGSMHVQQRTAKKDDQEQGRGAIDYTIVNPAHLPRELAEAVCQQCHLNVAAAVVGRGHKLADFRPGLPLQEFRQDYQSEADEQAMAVVGHVDQMHLSRCYTQSKTFTCTTCHNPHAFPAPDKRVTYYQAVCIQCHVEKPCKVQLERRQRESPANDCVQCHMPSAPTDIPHVAFTHHRIGVHAKPPAAPIEQTAAVVLRPFLEFPQLSDMDKRRSLGFVYLGLAKTEKQPALAATYRTRALDDLFAVHKAGLPDPILDATLSRVLFERGDAKAGELAEKALAHPDLTGGDRCVALFVLAGERLKGKRYDQARGFLLELTTLRRHPDDWLLLADCEKALGNRTAAVEALRTAAGINPRLVSVHQFLAGHYRQQGDAARADWHQKRAVQ